MIECDSAAQAPFGVPLTVLNIEVPPIIGRRLQAFGLRPGVQLTCLHKATGGGRVVNVASSHIALGPEILAGVKVSVAS